MTGFNSKRQAAADKLQEPWNEDEWRRNNWRCSHGWLRGEQCEICNAPQPPSEWAGIKAILDEYGLQAIDFVADFKAALAQSPQPAQEPVGQVGVIGSDGFVGHIYDDRKVKTGDKLYTTPPQREWVGLTGEEIHNTVGYNETREMYKFALALIAKLRERNT